ncbi:MAG: glycosyltransferase family 4 protein, partial [Clostridiales bacterium]|nr:glycosyltransferase family 4 protein [Clostridiales bacterium]
MLRIGQFTDTFLPIVDGVGRVALAYAETLAGMGHEVTVSAPMYNTGHRGGYPFELADYAAMRVPTAPQYRVGAASLDSHYRKRMDMIPLDIAHAHSPFGAGREALRIAKERGIPLVATFHSKYYDDFLKVLHSESMAKLVVANV